MSDLKNQPLTFDEFPLPSYEDWRAAAEEALKGAPFEKRLVSRLYEGIEIQPIYRREDLAGIDFLGSLPGQAPYVRGTRTSNDWKVEQDAPVAPGVDPVAELVATGSLSQSYEAAFNAMSTAPAIAVNAQAYHNAGGNAVQELAFALATGVEYLRQTEIRNQSVDEVAPKITFGFAMGPDFFVGIAKLRAARLLWSRIVAACGGNEASQKARIHATTSLWNRSKLDPYVNMLRGATEAFSAVAGGADSLNVGAFDEVIRTPDEFSKRIARNTQLILAEECHFDHVVDPGGGSYYVETLTSKIANAAWTLFQEVEKLGGILKALEAGFPQKAVNAVAAKKAEAVAQRRLSLIGVNVYANATEKPLAGSLEAEAPVAACCCSCVSAGLPKVEALPVRRAAEPVENLRAAVTAAGKPKVFLANMGPLRQHKARADFSTSFFQVGGFDVLENRGFQTVDEAAAAAKESGASIVVICSTDDTYPEIVPALVSKLKADNANQTVVLAGYPTDHVEAFKQAGVDEFIHIRANCYQVLRGIATKLGIA